MKDVTNPITYDKQAVPSHKICHRNFIETDIRGFGTKVGTYSNYSTIIEAMRPLFKQPNQIKQQEELLLRKKLLREINGQEIDRIKGVDAKGPDKEAWLHYWKIDPEDSQKVKEEKYYHNSLLIIKKPYFFRYLYKELDDRYKQYEKEYDITAKCMFDMKLKSILSKQNKTKQEQIFVKRYYKYMPILNTKCIMNDICHMIESVDFEIKYNKNCVSMLPYKDLNTFSINEDVLNKIKDVYQRFTNSNLLDTFYSCIEEWDDEAIDLRFRIQDAEILTFRDIIQELGLPTIDILTYIKLVSLQYKKFNWDFAWKVLGEDIIECIDDGECVVPVESKEGSEFLGKTYILKKITQDRPKIQSDYLII